MIAFPFCLFCFAPTHPHVNFHTSEAFARSTIPFHFHGDDSRESKKQIHDVEKADDFVETEEEAKTLVIEKINCAQYREDIEAGQTRSEGVCTSVVISLLD